MRTIKELSDLEIFQNSRVLVIMPHPDDESVFTAGLLHRLIKRNIAVRLITVTRGEKGINRLGISSEADLGTIREKELVSSLRIIGISDFLVYDFPDSELENYPVDVKDMLIREVRRYSPTHILTLEPKGIYDHPDHKTVSNILSRLPSDYRTLYATVPSGYPLPESLRIAGRKLEPLQPQYRLPLGIEECLVKQKAIGCHKSQFDTCFVRISNIISVIRDELSWIEYYSYRNPNY
jgi:LmbE family N-acetylglucosaminyl deacetylase